MKKKGSLLSVLPWFYFCGRFCCVENDHFVQEETQESTAQTESDAQAEEVAQTASMVQIYVDPSEYDAAIESENDYVSIYQTTSQETVIGKIRGSWATVLVKQKRWLKSKLTME